MQEVLFELALKDDEVGKGISVQRNSRKRNKVVKKKNKVVFLPGQGVKPRKLGEM